MASSNNPFNNGIATFGEDFDINEYVNFEQSFHNSPSPTSIKMEPQHSLDPRDIMLGGPPLQRQQYNGPSHNYDQFRQQTGLPTGAISHVHAVNQFSNSNHVKPAHFGAAQLANSNTGFDFTYDGQGSSDAQKFLAVGDNGDDYAIDPTTIVAGTQTPSTFRAWPGMHSEQAKQQAQAQADAEQQRHQEAMRSQQSLPTNFDQTYSTRSRSQTNASEPQVNEQISRLLCQMRQNSAVSVDDDDESKADFAGTSSSHPRRMDDDMDEDERLLASEEGKKLSSKERRQLRNKVSARAFRSRRKEYITQLEGEVAAKNNDYNELRMTNRHLLEQNRQLTQLCKAMLNHPSFGTFMEDMSNDPSILNTFAPQSASAPTSSQQSQTPAHLHEQPQSSQAAPPQQQNIHVGMTMMPETNLDFSTLNLGASHWTGGQYQQPQIFALHEVPAGPSLDHLQTGVWSEKSYEEPQEEQHEDKVTVPAMKDLIPLPAPSPPIPVPADEGDFEDIKNDPTFSLYVDCSAERSSPSLDLKGMLMGLEQSLSEKSSSRFQLCVRSSEDDAQQMRAIDRLFGRAEATLRRIDIATHHLCGQESRRI